MNSTDKQDKKQRMPTSVLSKDELLKAINKATHPQQKPKRKQPAKKSTSEQ